LQHVDRAAPQAIPVKLKFLNERLHERKIAPPPAFPNFLLFTFYFCLLIYGQQFESGPHTLLDIFVTL
jgi:hypothetical protein